jgi:N-formylglutamate amidohydrolase
MIELNRSLYMDEKTGRRSENFEALKVTVREILLRTSIDFSVLMPA